MATWRQIDRARRLMFNEPSTRAPRSYARKAAQIQKRVAAWANIQNQNFIGSGVAARVKGRVRTKQLTLKIYVKKKLKEEDVPEGEMIRESITVDGVRVPIDVEEVGEIWAEDGLYTHDRQDELFPGVGIGRAETRWGYGTLGCFVREISEAAAPCVLSCTHVLAANGAGDNGIDPDVIYHPGAEDEHKKLENRIGVLGAFSELDLTGSKRHRIDAAVARIDPSVRRSEFIPFIGRIASVGGVVKQGAPVQIYGARSGHKMGGVQDPSFDGWINYRKANGRIARAYFEDIVKCNDFSRSGDSGAAVVSTRDRSLLGLHFAGNSQHSFFCKIKTVFDLLRVRLDD